MIALLLALALPVSSHALEVFNLNVFDQLQGTWDAGFRDTRMGIMASHVKATRPDIVVFEEAKAPAADAVDSLDGASIAAAYPHRKYVHEMMGADNASYGYWVGARRAPREWIVDGFAFEGGVARKVLGGIWDKALPGGRCLGVIGLHLSYQNSEVRQKEAAWLLSWLKAHEASCRQWLVVGDFNASEADAEMKMLFEGGLKSLYAKPRPTVGPFNPIRRIYGADKPNLTIDWALGWNLGGDAEVVLDKPDAAGNWVSDHAGVRVRLLK